MGKIIEKIPPKDEGVTILLKLLTEGLQITKNESSERYFKEFQKQLFASAIKKFAKLT